MPYSAKILKDSLAPSGKRLTWISIFLGEQEYRLVTRQR